MKKQLILPLIFLFLSHGLSATNWYTDLETAQKVAIASNKLIVVDFWAHWCGPCKKMDRDVWSEEEVKDIMDNYVPLRIDFDIKKNLINQYGVKGIPYVVIMDANGMVLHNNLGYTNKQQTLNVLKQFRLNTSFMQLENAYYNRNPSYSTGLRLAQKYLDFSLHVDKNIKADILKVAKSYLSASEKFLDPDQSNFKMVSQKIQLMEANIDLYNGNYRRLEKFLAKKIDEESLRTYNWGIYCFLNYCLYLEKNDKEKIEKWELEIDKLNNPGPYKSRAKNLLASNL